MSLQIKVAKAQGDPGLFGFLGKAIGTVAKVGASFIPGPAGAITRTLTSKIFGGGGSVARALPQARALPTIRSISPQIMNGAVPSYPATAPTGFAVAAT